MLYYLLINKNNVISRDDLYLSLKGSRHDGVHLTIDMGISRLKEKLTSAGLCRSVICSVQEDGYILSTDKFFEILTNDEREFISGILQ